MTDIKTDLVYTIQDNFALKHLRGQHDQKLHGRWAGNKISENRGLYERQVNDPNFKRWFEGSKVVDDQGNPKIVYHGSGAGFNEFDITKANPDALYGPGFYFTEDAEIAAGISPNVKTIEEGFVARGWGIGGYVFSNQNRELSRELGDRDFRKAKRVFESYEIQKLAYDDIGTRENLKKGYQALMGGDMPLHVSENSCPKNSPWGRLMTYLCRGA